MSDPNEPPRPDDPTAGSGDAPPPPPPPPPPSDSPYGAAGTGGAGGYGAPPPPPTGGTAYGQPGPSPYSPTDAIGYGWNKFKASPATLLVPTLVAFVGMAIIAVLVYVVLLRSADSGAGLGMQLLVNGAAFAIFFLAYQFLAAGLYRGALRVADGHDFSVGELFQGYDKAQVLVASLVIAVVSGIGALLCYFPGIIVSFLTSYTLLFIVDRQMAAIDAIKASVRFVIDHLGPTILFGLLAYVITAIGSCICGVGLLIALPVTLVGYAYTYRKLHGQEVSPA
jgi:hypothetical protein